MTEAPHAASEGARLTASDRAAIAAVLKVVAGNPAEGELLTLVEIAAVYLAGIWAGAERCAVACEQRWRDGYRGDVVTGFANTCRAVPQHEFVGGCEIDPMQPNICQICHRPMTSLG